MLLLVFMVSHGVAFRSLNKPNSEPSWGLFIDVIYEPYWTIFGETFGFLEKGKFEVYNFYQYLSVTEHIPVNVPLVSWISCSSYF